MIVVDGTAFIPSPMTKHNRNNGETHHNNRAEIEIFAYCARNIVIHSRIVYSTGFHKPFTHLPGKVQ